MSGKVSVVLFGHSFPARFLRHVREQNSDTSVSSVLGLDDRYSVFVDGHPGLTYARVLDSLPHYVRRMKEKSVDLLIIDLGTNDLCNHENTPETVVQMALKFIDSLVPQGVTPQHIVFLSVIQRSAISRRGQVACSTFNHRVRRYNLMLSRALEGHPNAKTYAQRRINHPKYLVDGCHLNQEGMVNYCRGIKGAVGQYEI